MFSNMLNPLLRSDTKKLIQQGGRYNHTLDQKYIIFVGCDGSIISIEYYIDYLMSLKLDEEKIFEILLNNKIYDQIEKGGKKFRFYDSQKPRGVNQNNSSYILKYLHPEKKIIKDFLRGKPTITEAEKIFLEVYLSMKKFQDDWRIFTNDGYMFEKFDYIREEYKRYAGGFNTSQFSPKSFMTLIPNENNKQRMGILMKDESDVSILFNHLMIFFVEAINGDKVNNSSINNLFKVSNENFFNIMCYYISSGIIATCWGGSVLTAYENYKGTFYETLTKINK